MNVKKITAAVMAAAVLAAAAPVMGVSDPIGVVASAAEQELLVADVNTVFGNGVGNFSLGGGYFYVKSTGTFYKIGESELDNWRQTGKLTPSVVKNNTGRSFSGVDLFDEYVNNERYIYFSFMETDLEDGFHNFSHVCVLDKAKNTVELLFTTKSWSTDEKFTGTTVSVNEVTSNGIAKLEKRSYSDGKELELWYEWVDLSSNKVIFTWRNDSDPMLQTWISDKFAGYYTYSKDGKFYLCGLLKNGDTEVLEQREWDNPCEIVDAFDGGLVYGVNRYNEEYTWNGALIVEGRDYFVYLESTGKCYHIDPTIGDYYIHHFEDEFTASVNGNRLICNMYGGDVVAEIKDDGCKILIGPYDSIDSTDGEIYLVYNFGKNHGYFDKTGKELSMEFSDGTEFNGDYAAVRKDGKSYLIDRNMNTVSEKVDATQIWVRGENLFEFNDYDPSLGGVYNDRFVTLAAKSTGKPAAPADPVAIKRGDADGDGKIKLSDATTVLDHIVGNRTLTGNAFKNADLDNDGKVSINDAILLLKLIVNS